jgi:drug/metabolite transporter (DMT)-like permease
LFTRKITRLVEYFETCSIITDMRSHPKAFFAFLFICIVWGTTYLAIRVGVLHYPPFLFAGARQVLAGLILLIAALAINRKADLSRANLLRQAFIGFLLITMGNGLVTWAEQYVSSGMAALICATMPMSAVLINISNGSEKLNKLIVLGMILGISGVALICSDSMQDAGTNKQLFIMGIAALFIATFSWAWGSILNKKKKAQTGTQNALFNSGLQLLAGGLIMLLISPITDDYSRITEWWQPDALLAFVYLVIFGSVLAFAAYMYALKELPVGLVTSYAYVNPLVAMLLGYQFMDEPLNQYTVIAFVLIIAGIVIVNQGYKKGVVSRK